MSLLPEPYAFLQTALAAGLLASIGCGVMGSYVVVKRIGYLAGGIAHSVLGGMGVAVYLGAAPLGGALVAAILAALFIGWIKLHHQTHEDTLIGAVWALGMSIGVIFIARTPGYAADLMGYLFGNILLVSPDQLGRLTLLDALVVGFVLVWYRPFLAVAFDEEFARLRGLPVTLFYLLFLCLVALSVVLLVQVVGLILVIALLTLPAAIAGRYTTTLGRMMVLASGLGMLFTSAGIALSYWWDLPSGPVIILVAGSVYLAATLLPALFRKGARS